jgi:hypothetical protein
MKANNSPYDRIKELAEELEAISHPNEEQEPKLFSQRG